MAMSLIGEIFGRSPFQPLVEHTRKVHECVRLVRALMEALTNENYEEVHRLQDRVSKLEYEADQVKHELRDHLLRTYFLPVAREEIEAFLSSQDRIADSAEDFAVILLIRETKIHPDLKQDFFEFVDQVVYISETLMSVGEEMLYLVETSFGGAEAEAVLERISILGREEWKADRMQRKLCEKIYRLESELDPLTIMFYEKMLKALSTIANEVENAGDQLRMMIIKG